MKKGHHLRNQFYLFALAIMFYGAIAGCIVEERPYPGPAVVTTVGVEGGLVYYPDYEVYYDPGPGLYWFYRGGVWVTGPRPPGISVDVLLRSPSVRMDFRDSPANHHTEIIRQYPHGWRPGRGR